jgi:hypothetical protein
MNENLRDLARETKSKELEDRDRAEYEANPDARKYKDLIQLLRSQGKQITIEGAVDAFVQHPDFPYFFNQIKTIDDDEHRWLYVLKKTFEITFEHNVKAFQRLIIDELQARNALQEYGILVLCPCCEVKGSGTNCRLGGVEVEQCNGDYSKCLYFRDVDPISKHKLFSLRPLDVKPKILVPEMEVVKVDLEQLDNWYRGKR